MNQNLTEGFTESQSLVFCDVPEINSTYVFVQVSFDRQTFLSNVNSSFVVELGTTVYRVEPERCRPNSDCSIDIFGENFAPNIYIVNRKTNQMYLSISWCRIRRMLFVILLQVMMNIWF